MGDRHAMCVRPVTAWETGMQGVCAQSLHGRQACSVRAQSHCMGYRHAVCVRPITAWDTDMQCVCCSQ